jgi:hypothetical protein
MLALIRGSERRESAVAQAEGILAEELARRGWDAGQLGGRDKSDREKLALARRLVVSVAQAAIAQAQTPQTRRSVRRYQQEFARREGGPQRLRICLA